MNAYFTTLDIDTTGRVKNAIFVGPDYDVKAYNVAPELLTVTIHLKDQGGSSITIRLLRDAYDQFRQKIIKCEGYPK